MAKRLLLSSIVLAMFLMASVVGADVRSPLDEVNQEGGGLSGKEEQPFQGAATVNARAYRSPGPLRKVVISSDDAEAIAEARASGAVEISDYGSFKLLVIDQSAFDHLRDDRLREMSRKAGMEQHSLSPVTYNLSPIEVRDDFNVLLLRSGAIDTTAGDSPGSFLGLGKGTGFDVAQAESLNQNERSNGPRLRLIQFVGPVKRTWLERLRASGLEPVAYVPNNGYLVRGDARASERFLRAAREDFARGKGFVQWEGPFTIEHKIHPSLVARMKSPSDGEVTIAVQIAHTGGTGGEDLSAVKQLASSIIGDAYEVLGFINLKARIDASRIGEVAALGGVVNIEPWSAPQLLDERAAQIIAGELSADGKQPRGPGYMATLQARGFTSNFSFAIDVTDSGIDRGAITADKLHPDFLDSAGRSRVVYARDYTSELDPGDVDGHGTINLSIAGGGSISADANARDSAGFNHGLGIAPFALLGSSKIFQSTGFFDLIDPYTKLISEAYRDGARISSNSWASISNSYTIDSQEYDLRVRDAVPTQPGNQEMVICFAAGNAGPGRRIGSPSTAKNVISVGASENARKDGRDGCGVVDDHADSALDMAFFSSGGPLDDGRIKPDICAPGTHVQGAASQHPEFDGSGVCGEDPGKPYFPKGQTLYTWSSGTSHSTPQVAGAAALARQYFLNRGEEPSAALIKAFLVNSTTYLTGNGASGDLQSPRQGWGLLNLGRAFDGASKIFINQSHTFSDSGREFAFTGEVKDAAQPFRVTLAWSDAPGFSGAAPWVNDLDLEVTINGQVYRGNNFLGQESQPGGEANTKDNVESVWLPAGTIGTFVIRVRATNVAGDAVPGNGDFTDQDFALVVYNAERKEAAVAAVESVTLTGGADMSADPGESVSMRINVRNVSPVGLSGGRGTLTTRTSGVSVTTGSADFPTIAPGATGESVAAFVFAIDRTVSCGTAIQFVLDVTSGGSTSRVPFSVAVGKAQPAEFFTDDVESGQAKWTHGSGIKKKKNRIDTWVISTKRFRSGTSSWFTPNLSKTTDAHLDTLPIQIPADVRNLHLVFYHTFEFERGSFDGGVIEVSAGGDFEDVGSKILRGRYNGAIRESKANPLGGRAAWVEGRLGEFQQVIVDLSSFAGKTIIIRFRLGTDDFIKGLGWYIDDVSLRGDRVSCSP